VKKSSTLSFNQIMKTLPTNAYLLAKIAIFSAHFCFANLTFAQPPAPTQYELEDIEMTGSSRLTIEQLKEQLRVNEHTLMSDEWLTEARARLLSLGIFKDVFFTLKKGSKSGLAKLVIKANDDDTVLSDWAVGGEFGLSLIEPKQALGDSSIFRGYRIGLVGRNFFKQSHRGALLADVDSGGNLVFGQLAYGLPRFVSEAIQLDLMASAVEPKQRYFETEGYGLRIQSIWTRQRKGFDLSYGLAWYSNRHTRYRLEGWPDLVAGPKLGILRETRFLSFLPSEGYRAALSLMPSLVRRNEPVIETEIAATKIPLNFLALTASGRAKQTGQTAISIRTEGKVEIPLTTNSHGLRSIFYILNRQGVDHYKNLRHSSNESVIGYRYHSAGFIGDLNFRLVARYPFEGNPNPNYTHSNDLAHGIGDRP